MRNLSINYLYFFYLKGDYAVLKWDGQDFDSGEVVNSEVGVTLSFGKYHDGPVTSVHSPKDSDVCLTTGGRVFALWRDDFKDRPVLWRRCRHKLTSGKFNMYQVRSLDRLDVREDSS